MRHRYMWGPEPPEGVATQSVDRNGVSSGSINRSFPVLHLLSMLTHRWVSGSGELLLIKPFSSIAHCW